MALSVLPVPITDAGAWTASAFVAIASLRGQALDVGDVIEIYGSTLGTEGHVTEGTRVALVEVQSDETILTSLLPPFWPVFPFFRLNQTVGATPGGSILLNGS